MKNLFLVKPNNNYKKSFGDYVLSYKEAGEDFYFNKYKKGLDDFSGYLRDLDDHSKGIHLPEGGVATSNFWLIDNNQVVGIVRVRHQESGSAGHIGYDIAPCYRKKGYGTQILKLASKEAKDLGINTVIVTCNVDNTPSRRIIEKNNGKLMGTIFDAEENEHLYKYSIDIP